MPPIKGDRVYCSLCRWFIHPDFCTHASNIETKEDVTWLREITQHQVFIDRAPGKNSDNRCEDFEQYQ